MTQPTRIYKHSSAGTDWAALLLGAGLGLTLALQLTTVRKSDFTSLYASLASFSRLSALVGTYLAIVGIFLVARIPWVEKGVGQDLGVGAEPQVGQLLSDAGSFMRTDPECNK